MPSPAPGSQGHGHDAAADACSALLADYSLGITGKDLGELKLARAVIPPGARVHVGFTGSQDLAMGASTARAVKRSGFVPVPVIAARRLRSEAMLREYLDALRAVGASGSVPVVAGDPAQPRGPYPDAASVIGSGALEEYGVRQVSVAGHPGSTRPWSWHGSPTRGHGASAFRCGSACPGRRACGCCCRTRPGAVSA